jgi:hypothetical protein
MIKPSRLPWIPFGSEAKTFSMTGGLPDVAQLLMRRKIGFLRTEEAVAA